MKKTLAVLFACLLLTLGAFALAACDNETPPPPGNTATGSETALSVYMPDGAPALAMAQLMSEEKQFTVGEGEDAAVFKPDYNVVDASTIQTYVTGKEPKADIAVLPVNAAANLLGTGETYKMLGAVTHGNIYILSANGEVKITSQNAKEMFQGKKIGCLQLDNFVGYILRTVLNKYEVGCEVRQDAGEKNETQKAYLYSVDGAAILPTAPYDLMIAAEPVVNRKTSSGKLFVAGDMQALYGEQGYPQAVLVAKTELIESSPAFIEAFTAAVAANATWIGTAPAKTLYDAVTGHFAKEGTAPTFNETDLTPQVLERCAIRFEAAAAIKDRVNGLLAELSAAAEKTFAAQDAFFYTPQADAA